MMLLALPLEIWEMIFDFLPARDLQTTSKVPRLRVILAIARRSTHRLEVYKAGLFDVSRPGSRPLAERVELLKEYRARWESLRWAEVTRLPPRFLWIYHFAGNVLVYSSIQGAWEMRYLKLPFGGFPASSWDDNLSDLEHGIKTFSAYPEKNLLAVVEEWLDHGIPCVRLHIRRLDSTRDIVAPHDDGQLKVCQPFTTGVDLDVYIQPEDLSCEIEQIGRYLAILFACYNSQGPGYCAKFIMWDVITQEQAANITSWEYRSFVFLDHRWVLFGAICNDPNQDADRLHHPYLEIIDPTSPTCATTLELDNSVAKHSWIHSSVDISVGSGACNEEGSLLESGGMPFVSDASRGIITADVYLYHHGALEDPRFESYVFVLNIEDILAKVPLPSNPERRCAEQNDPSPPVGMFAYFSMDDDRYRIFSRHSYVAGFRYASPIRPLAPEDPEGPRCFFIYDFNPYRETPDLLPSAALGDSDPETGYPKSASEVTREVIGGLSCWRMRFDIPTAESDVKKCHVALTDAGAVLFELGGTGQESITVFSMW